MDYQNKVWPYLIKLFIQFQLHLSNTGSYKELGSLSQFNWKDLYRQYIYYLKKKTIKAATELKFLSWSRWNFSFFFTVIASKLIDIDCFIISWGLKHFCLYPSITWNMLLVLVFRDCKFTLKKNYCPNENANGLQMAFKCESLKWAIYVFWRVFILFMS